jgi:hypothetical protein
MSAPSRPESESGVQSPWRLIDDEPCPNDVFDVIAKYYDPSLDRFLLRRFSNCIQVNGEVIWCNPFDRLHEPERSNPIKLIEHGFRPTHWMPIPEPPVAATVPTPAPGRESGVSITERAKELHNYVAALHGLPSWDDCDDEVRRNWIKGIEECDKIGRGITYED